MNYFVYLCVALNTSILIGVLSIIFASVICVLFRQESWVGALMMIMFPCLISGCFIARYIV